MPEDSIRTGLGEALINQEAPAPEAHVEAPAEPVVPKAELDALNARVASLTGELGGLKETAALVEKAKALFLPSAEGAPLSKEDQAVKGELLRLFPDLGGVGDIKKALDQIKFAATSAQEATHANAWSQTQSLLKDAKIAADDPETAEMIAVNIREWVNKDPTRIKRYYSADTKEVIKEGFEHVVGKMYGPARLAKKRDVVNKTLNAPIVPARGGVAGGIAGQPGGADKLDFSDKKSVRAALRSAFPSSDNE